jgi:putative Ca2+/H+ antiporter (TMEM165/GDT1 family)
MYKNKWIVFVSIGVEAIVITILSVWLGQWLDLRFQLKNILTVILPLVGLVGWVYRVIFMVRKINQD